MYLSSDIRLNSLYHHYIDKLYHTAWYFTKEFDVHVPEMLTAFDQLKAFYLAPTESLELLGPKSYVLLIGELLSILYTFEATPPEKCGLLTICQQLLLQDLINEEENFNG